MEDPEALIALVAAALAEDVGAGDLTADAVVPEGARGQRADHPEGPGRRLRLRRRRRGDAPVRGRGLRRARRRGRVARRVPAEVATAAGPAAALLAAERTALNFLGHLSGIATLTARFVAGGRRHGRAHPRHPQDHPGPAVAGEAGGGGGGRPEPPHGPLRRDPGQGEPHRPRRGARARRRAQPARPGSRSRSSAATSARSAWRSPPARSRILLDNMDPTAIREALELRGAAGAAGSSRPPEGSPSRTCARWRRPGSSSSRSGR